jgi:hypothetical protein
MESARTAMVQVHLGAAGKGDLWGECSAGARSARRARSPRNESWCWGGDGAGLRREEGGTPLGIARGSLASREWRARAVSLEDARGHGTMGIGLCCCGEERDELNKQPMGEK